MAAAAGSPRKVLHVVGGLHTGGAEAWLAQAVPTVAAQGWQADFCLLDESEGPLAEEFRTQGFGVKHCAVSPERSFPWRLRRLMETGDYGVVHSHVLLFSGAIAAIAKWARVPVRIAHAHNSHDSRTGGVMRGVYRGAMRRQIRSSATHALACSGDAEAFLGCEAEWLPYGVDLELYRSPRGLLRRAELGIPADALVVGHVGRLTEQKNQGFMIQAFAEAAAREPRLHLAIAGEGLLLADLKQLAYSAGYADRVHFLGRRTDVPELLTGLFDAFLMPSLHEGLPVALIEAQAAGLPCLVSDRIGPQVFALPEMVERLPLDAGSTAWPSAIRQVAQRGRLAKREAVRRVRAAGFDSRSSGERLLAFYERVRAEHARASAQPATTSLAPFSS